MVREGKVNFLRGLSFASFDTERRRKLSKDIKSLAVVKLGIAGVLFFINPLLGFWFGTAGFMTAGLAGGVRLIPTFDRKVNRCSHNTGLMLKTFRRIRIHNHTRAYRSASRPAFASASGGDDSGGGAESDSGDPPGPNLPFPVTPFQNFSRKSDSFLSPWHVLCGFGCWRLSCRFVTGRWAS